MEEETQTETEKLEQSSSRRRWVGRTWEESKKMWYIAWPALLTAVLQYSIGFVTVAFVGHLGSAELAAVSLGITVIETFSYGILVGMGSALETLSGQAVGAGQFHMLGIYMQRSCIISLCTALILTPTFAFASSILKLLRQSHPLSELAGQYTIRAIPQLFAYAINFPLQKFFQSQSDVWVITVLSGISLLLHVFFCWLLVLKLGMGLAGAAYAVDISWWILNLGQIVYLTSGYFPNSWTGLSLLAFKSLGAFTKLSLASAVMLCLETWYYTAVILVAGYLHNPELGVDAVSICINLLLWTLMISLGFNVAVSVRVSNELGAGNSKAAKFAVVVAVSTSALIGVLFMSIIFITRNDFPKLFTSKSLVIRETSKIGYILALSILLDSIQPVLLGVAIGAGWQSLVAFINVGCYYGFGLPVGGVLGIKFKLGAIGVWLGMLLGTAMQTLILMVVALRTRWEKEATKAEERVRTFGGSTQSQQDSIT